MEGQSKSKCTRARPTVKRNRYFVEEKDHCGGECDRSSKKIPRAYRVGCAKNNLYDYFQRSTTSKGELKTQC